MNQKSIKHLILLIIFSCTLTIPVHVTGKKTTKSNTKKISQKKISYKNYIWIEGENAVATNFAKEKTYNFFCSNRHSLQLAKEADPTSDKGYYATYIFYVPGSKSYDFWMGCTPPGSRIADRPGYASPIEWQIDKGKFRETSSENTYVKNFYAPGGYYWTKITTGKLSEGKHTLTIRINQKRSSGWDYYFYLDAILLIPTYSEYLIPLMNFPKTAPKNFSVNEKPEMFGSLEYYKQKRKKNQLDRKSLFNLLQIYSWLYEYDKAIDLCKEYLKRKPKDINIRLLLAENYAWSDRLDDAIKEYKNIISIDKKNITARKLLAVLAGWNNRYDVAIKNYQEIINIDPRNIDAYISIATQYSWKGEADRSIEMFQKAESLAPNNIDVLYALGNNYHWTGKTYFAIKNFKQIISINEKEIDAYKKLAKIYLDVGKKDEADEIIEEASRIINVYPELSGFSLDVKEDMSKDRIETINDYKTAVAMDPDNSKKRKNLIDLYIWNKMEDEAIEEYNNLLNIKVLKKIDIADGKIKTLVIEMIKFQLIIPILKELQKKIHQLDRLYNDANSRLNSGDPLQEELNITRIKNDSLLISHVIKKIDNLEQSLSHFTDVISYYDKDVQNYQVQKEAIKWEFDWERILKQASLSKKLSPKDFRPRKVTGVLEYYYGNMNDANNELQFVYQKTKEKAVPLYILSLLSLSRYREADNIINDLLKDKQIKNQIKKDLQKLKEFILPYKSRLQQGGAASNNDTASLVKKNNKLASTALHRLTELTKDSKQKIHLSQNTMRQIYEKTFLDLENENVPIYKEIAQYHLNQDNQIDVLKYYNMILQVQPLNVEINYQMGNQNEVLGFWYSSKNNYEICINNQPDHLLSRKDHYDLQKIYSPYLYNEFTFFKDTYDKNQLSSRINNNFLGEYPFNDLMTFKAGYGFLKIDDKGGTTIGGQSYYPSDGSVMRHSVYGGIKLNIFPINSILSLTATGHSYKGNIDFEYTDTNQVKQNFEADISYTTINYAAAINFLHILKGLQIKIGYAFEDLEEQTQPLRLEFTNCQTSDTQTLNTYNAIKDKYKTEITSQTVEGNIHFSFSEYDFPFSDRMSFYNNIIYRMLSDDNIRTSSSNQLTFRIFSIPSYDIGLDLSPIFSYESSDFIEYTTGTVTNLPYWAPEQIMIYSGRIDWSHKINDIFSGQFSYGIFFQYGMEYYKDTSLYASNYTDVNGDPINLSSENFTQTTYSPGIKIGQTWDKLEFYINYAYTKSIASSSAQTPNPKSYESHNIDFGIQGKFFKVYTPEGIGTSSIVFTSANPKIITADNDGKNDYTTFTLTAFDEKGITEWALEIFDNKGAKVKTFGRKGAPPSTVKWDGTDKAHNLLPEDAYYYKLVTTNTANEKNSSKKEEIFLSRRTRAITAETSYKDKVFSPNKDGRMDTISFVLKPTDKEDIENWFLYIKEAKKKKKKTDKKPPKRKIFRTIKGFEFLPYDVEWDGRDNGGNSLPDGDYFVSVKLKYKDKETIKSPEIKVRIKTKISLKIKLDKKKFIPAKQNIGIIPQISEDMQSWNVLIYSMNDRLLKVIHGSGKLPKKITWNGMGDNKNIIGLNMPVAIQIKITDKAGNKALSNKEVVWIDFMKEKLKDKTVITLFDQGIIHNRKKTMFTNNGNQIVKRLINIMNKYRNSKKIRVVAHTSSDGSGSMNQDLSKKRSKALGMKIKNGLKLKTGVINIRGMGETVPYTKFNNEKWDTRYEIEIY